MREISAKYWVIGIYATLILVTVLAFWQLTRCDFIVYDDPVYVTENPYVRSGFTIENIVWAFNSRYASNWHPLTWFSHMLDWQLFGKNFGWHHLTSLLLHIASTLLLFAVMRQMTGAIWRSAFVAALFAIHPLHVESVAWLSERKDVLSTFFWFLTMICYVRYVKRPSGAGYLLTLLVFALGLMAKPMLVTLPFVLLLLDYWPLNRIENLSLTESSSRQIVFHLVREKIPFFALSTASSIVTFFAQRNTAVVQIHKLPVITRIANATVAYLEYIEKTFWPSRLAAFYPYSTDRLSIWRITSAALLLVLITIWAIRLAPRHRYLTTGWFWYLGTLVPVIGLVHVGLQARADRYTYVSLTGLFIMIAWGVPELLTNWRYRKILLAVSVVVIISALSICTWFQTALWRNNVTLFEHALKVTDDNYLAYSLLAYSYHQQGKLDQALEYDAMALQINPGYPPAHVNTGIILFQKSKLDEAAAHFKQALQINPDLVVAHKNLGKILGLQGKLEEAAARFRKGISLESSDSDLYRELGTVLGRQGRFDEALEQLNEALRIKPDFADAHSNLGYAFLCQNKFDQAAIHLEKAIQLDPNSDKAHYHLAIALNEKGEIAEAVTHLWDALHLRPDWIEPLNSLAWFLAAYKDTPVYNPQKAVELAKRACELTSYNDARLLDTLALSYAAAGNFKNAVVTVEKALNIVAASKDNKLIEQIQKRLELYETGQPYVESVPKQSEK